MRSPPLPTSHAIAVEPTPQVSSNVPIATAATKVSEAVIDLEEPGVSPALRPKKKKRHRGRRGKIIWSYAMDMELMKQFNTACWYGILQHGDKKKTGEID